MEQAATLGYKLKHDAKLMIATGRSRKETNWKNTEITWSDLVNKLSLTNRTYETYADYLKLPKERQDEIKDVGGFVLGTLKGGKRRADSVGWRYGITLDADHVTKDIWLDFGIQFDFAGCLYSTHKYSSKKPRLRIIVPLARPVTADEYQAISRRIAEKLGMDQFDQTTYEPERLMYWPSTAKDGEYSFEVQDAPLLDPDEILNTYIDWRDPSYWPESEGEKKERKKLADKQGDPLQKDGIIGSFCRTYTIQEAIETFLSDVYSENTDSRYTYAEGTTSGGLIIYEDKFAYSHHSTDPISGRLVNAFDLVRLHKFGDLDDHADPKTPVAKLPSCRAMRDFAAGLDQVKHTITVETFSKAAETVLDEENWSAQFDISSQGAIAATFKNFLLILQHDEALRGRLAYNEFSHRTILLDDMPWRKKNEGLYWMDRDDAELRGYIETHYGLSQPNKLRDAMQAVVGRNRVHPVKEYLNGLEWDGVDRLDWLLIEYQGADDSIYTRAVTRKTLTAAVARIMEPACKFDQMLVLVGDQGLGKSTLFHKLAGEWFNDSLSTVQGKEAYEQLQGSWILEMAELSATKKADVEAIKHFLSKREDIFRVSYGHHTSIFPRQCIFIGTTNDREFLRDRTGNRRFWPVQANKDKITKDIWKDLDQHEIDQLWAEAVQYYNDGEELFISGEAMEQAKAIQAEHTEEQPLVGLLREFLDKPITEDWYSKSVLDRRGHFSDEITQEACIPRDRVCVAEIWCELMGGDIKRFNNYERREITSAMMQIEGWTRYRENRGRLKFGNEYGLQSAFVRIQNELIYGIHAGIHS